LQDLLIVEFTLLLTLITPFLTAVSIVVTILSTILRLVVSNYPSRLVITDQEFAHLARQKANIVTIRAHADSDLCDLDQESKFK